MRQNKRAFRQLRSCSCGLVPYEKGGSKDKSQVGCTKSRQKYFIVVRYFCFIWEGNQEIVPLLHEKMMTSFLQDEGNRAKKMDR